MLSHLDDISQPAVHPRSRDVSAHLRALRPLIDLLPPTDRMLLELGACGERSLRQLAHLTETNPGQVHRRIHSLLRRVNDPFLRHLTTDRCPLTREMRQLALERLLLNLSIRDMADRHRMKPHAVRKALVFVRAYAQAQKLLR